MQASTLSKKLIPWQIQHGRHDLPWQKNPTPYHVWVSEIMLQQTQVATVKAYYLRFMQQLPTLHDLAMASEETVLQLWTGLGYYARARYLHRAAQMITTLHQGIMPDTLEALLTLPGIGRSTAGAIRSLALNKCGVILDGNVKRVLSRVYAISAWPGDPHIQKKLWELASYHTPKKASSIYNQALMDLGATLCTRNAPRCPLCPLRAHCLAYQQQQQAFIPWPKPKRVLPEKSAYLAIVWHKKNNTVLLEKRTAPGIWGGLWCFPECPSPETLQHWLPRQAIHFSTLPVSTHRFTHYHWHISGLIIITKTKDLPTTCQQAACVWYPLDGSEKRALAAPVQRWLTTLDE